MQAINVWDFAPVLASGQILDTVVGVRVTAPIEVFADDIVNLITADITHAQAGDAIEMHSDCSWMFSGDTDVYLEVDHPCGFSSYADLFRVLSVCGVGLAGSRQV